MINNNTNSNVAAQHAVAMPASEQVDSSRVIAVDSKSSSPTQPHNVLGQCNNKRKCNESSKVGCDIPQRVYCTHASISKVLICTHFPRAATVELGKKTTETCIIEFTSSSKVILVERRYVKVKEIGIYRFLMHQHSLILG